MNDDLEIIDDNITHLAKGWYEEVRYVKPVAYHRAECDRNPDTCQCPVANERRVRRIARKPLLVQLKEYAEEKDVDRNPKAARGAPRVKTPKLHPELNGFLTLDELSVDIYMTVDRLLDEGGRDRTYASMSVMNVLGGIGYQLAQIKDAHPDLIRDFRKKTQEWRDKAERTLNISVSDQLFAGTVCGECSGGLAHADGDVRCVGTPTRPPCGAVYPPEQWLDLYQKGKAS